MTDINNIDGIYFVGIGGIGMSALALYFLNRRALYCWLRQVGIDYYPIPFRTWLQYLLH